MKISTIPDQIDIGSMVLPEFQRGYVWNRNQVRDLMNSLYRRFPVWSLLVWETKKDKAAVEDIKDYLEQKGSPSDEVEHIAIDMSLAYIAACSDYFPEAAITFDRFHVVQIVNEALDTVRKLERKESDLLKGHKYTVLKNPHKLYECILICSSSFQNWEKHTACGSCLKSFGVSERSRRKHNPRSFYTNGAGPVLTVASSRCKRQPTQSWHTGPL